MPAITQGERHDLRYIRGDRIVRDFEILTFAKTAENITGWTWMGQVKAKPNDTAVLAPITINVTNAAAGLLTIEIVEADSASDALVGAWYDVQRILPWPLTYTRGRLRPKKDVSR